MEHSFEYHYKSYCSVLEILYMTPNAGQVELKDFRKNNLLLNAFVDSIHHSQYVIQNYLSVLLYLFFEPQDTEHGLLYEGSVCSKRSVISL